MDPISHAVFWWTITHALFGKTYGRKVTTYGLVASMLPDIDILVQYIPGINPLWASFFHRTMTHSVPFALIAAPLIWRAFSCTPWWKKISWKTWWLITLIALFSHIFLDWMTTYGVRVFRPFIDYGFEANIISVIDVFFTIPLWCILLWYLITSGKKKNWSYAWWSRWIGVSFAWLYLAIMALFQTNLKASIEHDMQQAWVQYTRIFASPQILQPFLRYGIVQLPDNSYKVTYTSIFDSQPRTYQNIYGYHDDIKTLTAKNHRIDKLIRRSHGWYKGDIQWWITTFVDLRFGKLLWWENTSSNSYVFTYAVWENILPYQLWQAPSQPLGEIWTLYWRRVWGN